MSARGTTAPVEATDRTELDQLLASIRNAIDRPNMAASVRAAARMLASLPTLTADESKIIGLTLALIGWASAHASDAARAGAAFGPTGEVDAQAVSDAQANILGVVGVRLIDAARFGGL